MSIDYAPLPGALRLIHPDLVAAGQPVDVMLARLIAHNQELIDRTFVPRHLVNQAFPEEDHPLSTDGTLIGQWGRIPRIPGISVTVRVNCAETVGTAATLYVTATTALVAEDWTNEQGESRLLDLLSGLPQLASVAVSASSTRRWYTVTVEPPDVGAYYYLCLWGVSDSGGSTAELDIWSVSAVEARKASGSQMVAAVAVGVGAVSSATSCTLHGAGSAVGAGAISAAGSK